MKMKVKDAKQFLMVGGDIRARDKGGDTIILRKEGDQLLVLIEEVADEYSFKDLGSCMKDWVKEVIHPDEY